MLSSAEVKLSKLREFMKSPSVLPKGVTSLAAYIVPSEDAHQSEYTAPQHKRREFISGFTGSAGTAVVTPDKALLWTDGRYFLQANKELDPAHWNLMKANTGNTPEIHKWLSQNLQRGGAVGVDPLLISQETWKKWETELKKKQTRLVSVDENLVDLVWQREVSGSGAQEKPVFVYPVEYAGESWQDKVKRIQAEMEKEDCDLLVVSELDEIAWLLNLRGSDIEFNPVFFAYAFVPSSGCPVLFINQSKITEEVAKHLHGVQIKSYESVLDTLEAFSEDLVKKLRNVWMGPRVSHALAQVMLEKDDNLVLMKNTPTKLLKAVKNETELKWMRNAHVKDGLALCEYLYHLDSVVGNQSEKSAASPVANPITEVSGAKMLDGLRAQLEGFVSLSFPTISGSGPNGAVIHYSPAEESDRVLSVDELYLVDSGAQYLDGTTDVTRTVSFAKEPPAKQRETFTLVLKGHIALARMVVPEGVLGYKIDSCARAALWNVGLDYLHGTGHGVGSFLNVHEGPQSISYRSNPNEEGLKANMIVSNEPGYYEAGQFGIRIESLIVYSKHETKYSTEGKDFLKAETITCVPLDRKLIDKNGLRSDEIAWVDEYHRFCREKLVPVAREKGKEALAKWIINQTEPL